MSRRRRVLDLNEAQRSELAGVRDHHPKPYMRERAAALLLIAGGLAAYRVAQRGVLKPRKADTVYRWLNAYLASGLHGLTRTPSADGRGFSP